MMHKRSITIVLALICIVAGLILFLKYNNKNNAMSNTKNTINSINDLNGKTLGNVTGSVFGDIVKSKFDVKVVEYNTEADRLQALIEGKIDGILNDEPAIKYIVAAEGGRFKHIPENVTTDFYAPAVSLDNKALGDKINTIIAKLRADGTIARLDEKWFNNIKEQKSIDVSLEARNGVLKVGTMGQSPPFSFIVNNKIVGYDIEIMYMVAKELGMGIEVIDMNVASLIPSLKSSKVDVIIGTISVTEERSKSILFLEPTYKGGLAIMTKDENFVQSTDFWTGLKESYYKNFIHEDRYKLIVKGLGITIWITLGGAMLGTLLAFMVCLLRRSTQRYLNITALFYIRVVQGTPIVVLLMLLYYVVFAKSDLDAIWIAIIAFGINFSAYVAEMMRTGIDAVDKGQIEAGKALGFNQVKIYQKIIYPQALKHILPVYKGEFISMLKMTSIVGYIAIQDLTKMSDIIRSRTYEAFFPLITTAFIYFVTAYIFIYFLNRLEASVDPKRRNRCLG